jgi:galactokinase
MRLDQIGQFYKNIENPESAISRAVQAGRVQFPLNEHQIRLVHRRIADIEEEFLPALKQQLVEEQGNLQAFLNTQAPRNWEKLKDSYKGRLVKQIEAEINHLKEERKMLRDALRVTERMEAARRKAETQEKARLFNEKAQNMVEKARSMPQEAELVLELARALKGKSLEQAFGGVLTAITRYEDLEVEKRFLEQEYGLVLDSIPALQVNGGDPLREACEQILGRPLEIKRNRFWRRVWAEQRAQDRDEAARRLLGR